MARHDYYNRDAFPHYVCNHGNWDIYANGRGYCASIPTDEAAADGCKATHFGDLGYVLVTLGYAPNIYPLLKKRIDEIKALAASA